jgi:hypothetical protein
VEAAMSLIVLSKTTAEMVTIDGLRSPAEHFVRRLECSYEGGSVSALILSTAVMVLMMSMLSEC